MTDTTALTNPIELEQLSMEFKIRPRLKWGNGEPVTAADYELSWAEYQDVPLQLVLNEGRTVEEIVEIEQKLNLR